MSKQNDLFIADLAKDLRPGRQWSPWQRTGFVIASLLAGNTLAFLAYQGFRPGFASQLAEYWRFSLEILSATIFSASLIILLFDRLVPGRKTSKALKIILSVSGLSFISLLMLTFVGEDPMTSKVGARGLCVEEVLVYGLVGSGLFMYFANKTQLFISRWSFFLMGFAAGLVPGTLMQLACMYSPLHNLLLHYVPALVVGGFSALLLPLLKKQ